MKRRILIVEVVAPTQALADRCIRRLTRKFNTESNALLRLAEIRKNNVGFCMIESNSAANAMHIANKGLPT